MDSDARGFRESRISMLDFLANPVKQLSFAERVYYDDYASEFYCWWFDDFYPESKLFQQAFQSPELEKLRTFSDAWQRESEVLGETPRSMKELLSNCNWSAVVDAAQKARACFTDSIN
jgi:hypothetical protein